MWHIQTIQQEVAIRNHDWLLQYLRCPLFTSNCSETLKQVQDGLQCECGAIYDADSGALCIRPIDHYRSSKQVNDKYQEDMFVNMFALRQYGPLIRRNDASSDIRQIFDIRGGAENFYQTLLGFIHSYVPQAKMIADIGCGTGRLAGEIAKINESVHVIGMDYSPAMVVRANQIIQSQEGDEITFPIRTSKIVSTNALIKGWGLSNCAFVVADGQYTPLRDSVADIVTCINVFHRVANPSLLFDSIKRVLKLDGILLVSNSYDWKEEFTPRDKWFDQFDSLLDPAEWQKLAEIDGILYVTPTYNRKFDLTVNHIQLFRRIA